MTNGTPVIRRAVRGDAPACHELLWASVTDLAVRQGTPLAGSVDDWWANGESLHRFLADHNAEWWVAAEPGGTTLIGYARSIRRGALLELTEFFVRPGHQSAGVGAALLARAFPDVDGEVRSIIATTDVRALGRYYRAGVVARFPLLSLAGAPVSAELDTDIVATRVDVDSATDRSDIAAVDTSLLGSARDESEIRWLAESREGFVYRRGDTVVGYGFVGKGGAGPIAVYDADDQPAVLAHLEARAAAAGIESIEFQVPAPNEVATRHLLGRGYRIDPWINQLMSNRPFGAFDRFLGFGAIFL